MFPPLRKTGLLLVIGTLALPGLALAHDDGQWRGHGHATGAKPDWQVREEQRQRRQAEWERERERQRQWQEEQRHRNEQQQRRNEARQLQQQEQQRRSAEQQRHRDEAWQRSQEEELRRRAEQQRRRDEAWQREQQAIQNRRAAARHGYYAGGSPRWERGRRYDGPIHRVQDWNRYPLRAPTRDQYWVRTDHGDYLLLDAANQLIMDMLLR